MRLLYEYDRFGRVIAMGLPMTRLDSLGFNSSGSGLKE